MPLASGTPANENRLALRAAWTSIFVPITCRALCYPRKFWNTGP